MLKKICSFMRWLFSSKAAKEAQIKVFDLDGHERDLEYAKAKYGVAFRRAEVAPGQKVYRLVELWEKTGHHSLVTQVLDENDNPIDRKDVAFYWPDAPDPPDPPTVLYDHDWYRNFKHGLTNLNGDVGPGMGGGAWIDVEPDPPHNAIGGGPHAVWVRDPSIPSDICEKLGMRGGTNHDHLDQKFKLMEGDQGIMLFQEDELRRRFDRTEGTNHIAVNCLETSKRNFFDARIDLRVGEDWRNPDWKDPNPHHPKSLYHFNLPADYVPRLGETSRIFWMIIRHAGTEIAVGEPMAFEFKTGEHGIYHAYVDWREEPFPPPDPEPLPDPEPPPDPGWTMVADQQEGILLIIGTGLPNGTPVTVTAPWGDPQTVIAGSKSEHDPGGWEVNVWHKAEYTIGFLGQVFSVAAGGTVRCTFSLQVEPTARLVSVRMPLEDAEELLAELRDEGYNFFALEGCC